MTQSPLANPAPLNGEVRSSAKKSDSDRNGSPAKKKTNVFPLAKSDPPTYLDHPIMPTKTAPADEKNSSTENKMMAARDKNLDLALQQIAKDYGDGAIMRLGDEKIADIEVIPTGNILIDRALGVGGFPRGRVVEVYGPESSGKTTLTLTVIAQAQKRGGLAAFIDVEHALDPQYAKRLGVDICEDGAGS